MVSIKNAKILGKKKEIVEQDGTVAYDMYSLKVEYAKGKPKKVRVFTHPGTIDGSNPDQEEILMSAERLEKLMDEQGRTNYIFAGKLKTLGGVVYPTNDYILPGGKRAWQVFEDNVFDLKDAVTQMEHDEQLLKAEQKEIDAEISKNVKDMLRESAEKRKAAQAEEPKKTTYPDLEPPAFLRQKPEEKAAEDPEIPEFLKRKPTTRPTARPVVIPEFLKKYQEELAKNPDAARPRRTSAKDLEIPDFLKKKPGEEASRTEIPPVPQFRKTNPREFEIPSFLRKPSEDKKTTGTPNDKKTELEVPDFLKDDKIPETAAEEYTRIFGSGAEEKKDSPKTPEETYEEMLKKIEAQIAEFDKKKAKDPSSVDDKMYQAAVAIKKMLEVQLGKDEDKGTKPGRQEDDGMDR